MHVGLLRKVGECISVVSSLGDLKVEPTTYYSTSLLRMDVDNSGVS